MVHILRPRAIISQQNEMQISFSMYTCSSLSKLKTNLWGPLISKKTGTDLPYLDNGQRNSSILIINYHNVLWINFTFFLDKVYRRNFGILFNLYLYSIRGLQLLSLVMKVIRDSIHTTL